MSSAASLTAAAELITVPDGEKLLVTYGCIHRAIKHLSETVKTSDAAPDVIIAIGTGGLIPGRILKTFLGKPLLFVTVNLYNDETNTAGIRPQKIQWIEDGGVLAGKNIVIVDEVDDTRTTLQYVAEELNSYEPASVSWLVVFNKNKPKRGQLPAFLRHYWVAHQTADVWIRFPWDALDVDEHEAKANLQPSFPFCQRDSQTRAQSD